MLMAHSEYANHMQNLRCRHNVCRSGGKGVGACIVDPTRHCVLLGLERYGRYAGRLNICAGSVEVEDGGCLIEAMLRELREEF
eukprot:33601-Eustigmatos_ZCMA.PRE.1